MGKPQTQGDVDVIKSEVERPGDRGRKRDEVRGDPTTDSISGTGSSGTLLTNNSAGNWWLDGIGGYALGASPNVVCLQVDIEDENSNVVTKFAGPIGSLPWDIGGHIVKPGWSVTYTIEQSDSASYNIQLAPMTRKAAPGTGGDDGGATPPTIIEDWERPTPLADYTGDTASASLNTSTTFNQDTSLELPSDGNSYTISSTSGLPSYPQEGDSFEVAMFHTAGYNETSNNVRTLMMFGGSDTSNTYQLVYSWKFGVIEVRRVESGSVVEDTQADFKVDGNEWLEFAVDWGDPIVATVTDGDTSAQASLPDDLSQDLRGDFVAWRLDSGETGETALFDYARKP